MQQALLALLLVSAGLLCIGVWAIFRIAVARQDYELRRRADAVKHHIVRGGGLPEELPSAFARGFSMLRWRAFIADGFLVVGVAMLILAQSYID